MRRAGIEICKQIPDADGCSLQSENQKMYDYEVRQRDVDLISGAGTLTNVLMTTYAAQCHLKLRDFGRPAEAVQRDFTVSTV